MAKMSSIFPAAVMLGAAASAPVVAWPAPVTKADLAGKRICWSNGATATYGKGGSFDCSSCGHGAWRLVGDTLTENLERGVYIWKITKDGRTFHMSMQNGFYEMQGSYCR